MNKHVMKILLIITIGIGIFAIFLKTVANTNNYRLVKGINYYKSQTK